MVEVAKEKEAADILKEAIGKEEAIVSTAVNEANLIKSECEADLAEAMPALLAAQEALECLDKKQLDLLKSMKSPPNTIKLVMRALCLILYPNPTEKIKNEKTLKLEIDWWASSLKLLGRSDLL